MTGALAFTIGQHSIAGRKAGNEDSYGVQLPEEPLLSTRGAAMAIADGMSGSDAGKEASENCVKSFMIDYYSTSESLTVKTAGGQILSSLNRWLHGQGQSRFGSDKGMVSTLSALVLKSATAYIFHVGDSRISLLRDGALEPLTQDHRVIVSQDKTFLSRAVGIDLNLDVDFKTIGVEVDDIFVFTTDGVHEYLRNAEIESELEAFDSNPDGAAKAIVDRAYAAGSPDNLTCQIVRVDALGVEEEDEVYRRLQELPFPPPLEEGMILDGFRIIRELHASKRTQVYLAVEEDSGVKVVLKTPSINYEDDPAYLQLFTREEWVGKRLNNPHVLKVHDQTQRRRFLYYAMEYIEGETLRQWMNDHPNPEITLVRPIVEQIITGLRAFHRMEMIHQDLKPENIVIDHDGTVKIIDFGSVKIAGLEEVSSPVEDPKLLGTAGYTAPDYFQDQPATNRSDIYSLGVIVYEMLTGEHPYGKATAKIQTLDANAYIPASRHQPDVAHWIDGALAKAVHPDFRQRYDRLSEFQADLTRQNPSFAEAKSAPLLQRNPVAFWKGISFFLALTCLYLLVW